MGRSPVCCVEFNPAGGALVAVGCADRRAYGYDIRKLVDPIVVLDGHGRTVTHVRFLDAHRVVSAGTDGCLKLWNINESRVIRTFKGHVNNRSFVGLPVWRNGGLLGCGSENNKVFVYDSGWGEPIWMQRFEPGTGLGRDHGSSAACAGGKRGMKGAHFWQGDPMGICSFFWAKESQFYCSSDHPVPCSDTTLYGNFNPRKHMNATYLWHKARGRGR